MKQEVECSSEWMGNSRLSSLRGYFTGGLAAKLAFSRLASAWIEITNTYSVAEVRCSTVPCFQDL